MKRAWKQASCVIVMRVGVMAVLAWGLAAGVCRSEWKEVKVPDVWKSPPKGQGGYAWYRCVVDVPANWRDRSLELFVEPVDDAREIFLNGNSVGRAGSFPPQFRSGLGGTNRFSVAADQVQFGRPNVVAIRVYDSDGRGGFNVAAPVLFGGDEAIRLQGVWQFQPGDDPAWAQWQESTEPPQALRFAVRVPKAEAERILRQLPGEEGPLPVAEALRRFKAPDDLTVEIALSEPEIGQPLFMSFDERGRLWVMNYLQYPNPAGLTVVSRDKFLRSVYDKVPQPPPHHVRGADKITIHEDTDGDGRFDRHATFVDGLNMATSFARGRGGVWVLNPPYLLFYPDRDHDDVPDGDPVVHLEGLGLEDSHSIANNLRFGPDGWLYAAQGSTVTGHVRRYGTQDKPVHSMGQLIWRYHPEQRRYEIFGEGGGNTFGVEIDAKGRLFSGHNGGDTRGFYYVQGGYSQKGFGKHGELSNPYAFGYFPPIPHHKVPRFTHTFLIYEGAALSAQYAGKIFGVAPLQSHVVISDIQPDGAAFKTQDVGHALSTNDPWFRPVAITPGPEGAIYVADFYEQRIDHASHYQGRVDKASGRIYRIRAKEAPASPRFDYGRLSSEQLLEHLRDENRWHRECVVRLLYDRHDGAIVRPLEKLLADSSEQLALEALWALNASGGLTESVAIRSLSHSDPYVRLWTVRLLGDNNQVSPAIARQLTAMSAAEPHVEVRCQLACTARRLPVETCLSIVKQLLLRDEDLGDPYIPLLLWWAIEAKTGTDRGQVLALFDDTEFWRRPLVARQIVERLMRRLAQSGTQPELMACARLLQIAPDKDSIATLMKGFELAFTGRELAGLPSELTAAMAKAGGGSLALRLRRADPDAVREALQIIADSKAKEEERIRYAQIFGQIRQPQCVPVLLETANSARSNDVRSAALSSLQSYDNPKIGNTLLERLSDWPPSVRDVAMSVLASRQNWSLMLLDAVDNKSIARETVPVATLQKMLFHPNERLASLVRKHWGELRDASTEEMREQVERLAAVVSESVGNPYRGKRLFAENCGKCHVLFNSGGQIGPDLTTYKRDDLRGILMHVVNPSLEIREGFESYLILTADGRTLNGFINEQDNRVVVLKQADGQTIIVPRDDIEEMTAVRRSIMPEGLLKDYQPQQVRDLFAFLRTTQPLPE